MNFEERLAEAARRVDSREWWRTEIQKAKSYDYYQVVTQEVDTEMQAVHESKFVDLCSPERMLLVAEILRAVRTYDLAADVARLLKKLDEVDS